MVVGSFEIQVGGRLIAEFRSRPSCPQPLPRMNEERLIRIGACAPGAPRYALVATQNQWLTRGLDPP
jgi:hypothetical protein